MAILKPSLMPNFLTSGVLEYPAVKLLLAPGLNECFQFDTQRIGDTIDVVEIRDHLRGVVDGAVTQPGGAQSLNIGWPHLGWAQRQFIGIGAQCSINRAQGRSPPVARDGMNVGVGFFFSCEPCDLSTEVMRVAASSVDAVVRSADDDSQHFALRP